MSRSRPGTRYRDRRCSSPGFPLDHRSGSEKLPLRLGRGTLPPDPPAEPHQQIGQHPTPGFVIEPEPGVEPLVGLRDQELGRREDAGLDVAEELPEVELRAGRV